MSWIEVLREADGFDDPLRCEGCGAQFACEPKVYGESGPMCQECIRRSSAMPSGAYYSGRETFGDRLNDVILEDV